MITRLSADNESPYGSSIRQLIFVVLGIAFGLIVPVLIRKLTFLDKWTWIYAGVGGAALGMGPIALVLGGIAAVCLVAGVVLLRSAPSVPVAEPTA